MYGQRNFYRIFLSKQLLPSIDAYLKYFYYQDQDLILRLFKSTNVPTCWGPNSITWRYSLLQRSNSNFDGANSNSDGAKPYQIEAFNIFIPEL